MISRPLKNSGPTRLTVKPNNAPRHPCSAPPQDWNKSERIGLPFLRLTV